jgi:acid phosphatase type 7
MTSSNHALRGRACSATSRLGALAVASATTLCASLALAAPPRIAKGPYMTELDDHGVDVRFQLEGAPAATVVVVRDDGVGESRKITSRNVSGVQVARVAGLEPGTRYDYSVRVGGAALGAGHFSTGQAPGSVAPTTFILYGDDRTDEAAHALVVRAMMAVPSDFLVQTGDMVAHGGNADEWQSFFDVEKALLADRPIFAAIGNHEMVDDAAGAAFARYFGFLEPDAGKPPAEPYSTARVGNVRLFLLNTMNDWQDPAERAWLDRELARSDAEGDGVWRIAVMHHGPWSAGPHGPNTALLDAHVPELLAAHKIDLVVSGHDHDYERGQAALKYVVSGGGGAPLYPVHATPTTRKVESVHNFVLVTAGTHDVRIVATRSDGSIIERCGFVHGGGWDCDAASGADASPGPASSSSGSAASSAAPAPSKTPPTAPPPKSSSCAVAAVGATRTHRSPWAFGLAIACGALLARRSRRPRQRG